ncbi:hypothetical protein ANANG_G00075040 [Anguilla anguilla]|uniref:DELTA-sagatoxin-Srs1a n=1 Tax=Anguilla anguilla TaxID=7936 RepID=A0A9D3MIW9_ANGAN|nr:hypothetical protein ANANG_G00075040 [Anguilla anguilla]
MSNDAAGVASAAISGVSLLNDIVQESINASSRSVSIHLTNNCESKLLINPQVYTNSGYCCDPPQPTVGQGVTETCGFENTKGAACGAVGVLTYDITEDRKTKAVKRLAIMFSVPFDYASFENWFAVGLFDTAQACDSYLYNLMYNNEGSFKREKASGSEISFQKDEEFILLGTMSPAAKAEIKVELWDKD